MRRRDRWTDHLSDADLAFLKRFLLASGTLKELAADYGISYPTVRVRLDRLIAKVEAIDRHSEASDFEIALRSLHAEGRIDAGAYRELLDAYRDEEEGRADRIA